MGFHKRVGSLLTVVTLAIAAGCSGGGSQVPTGSRSVNLGSQPLSQSTFQRSMGLQNAASGARVQPVSLSPALQLSSLASCPATGLLMFVSNSSGDVVDVFSGSTMCHQIKNLSMPQGLAYSQAFGKLYIANTNTSQVYIYKPPFTTIFKKLEDPGQYPLAIALCNGYTAVTNIITTSDGPGSISIYTGGSDTPVTMLSDPNASREYYPTCDTSGNLFTSYSDINGVGHVNEWIGGKGTPIEIPITLEFPGGTEWVKNVLMVGDQEALTIGFYKAPYKTPFRTINMTKGKDPVTFRETPNDLFVQTADAETATSQRYHVTGGFVSKVTIGGRPIGVTFNEKP